MISVLHLIDSLQAGGAERVAVNLVNNLPRNQFKPHLCVTRQSGPLESQLAADVNLLILNRRSRWDIGAVLRLIAYIQKNDIQILHAHSSSLFIAKVASTFTKCRLIWHDHLGGGTQGRNEFIYRIFIQNINAIFSVTHQLAEWAHAKLGTQENRIFVLSNFIVPPTSVPKPIILPGSIGYRVVCVANIRPPKDQLNLLYAFQLVVNQQESAHLLLVGEPIDPNYSRQIMAEVENLNLQDHVSWLGGRDDVPQLLASCDIAVLNSISEGFPLTLLEYGWAGLPVVATRVGECAAILDEGSAGLLVPPGDPQAMASKIVLLLSDIQMRQEYGTALKMRVQAEYSVETIIQKISNVYQSILQDKEPIIL